MRCATLCQFVQRQPWAHSFCTIGSIVHPAQPWNMCRLFTEGLHVTTALPIPVFTMKDSVRKAQLTDSLCGLHSTAHLVAERIHIHSGISCAVSVTDRPCLRQCPPTPQLTHPPLLRCSPTQFSSQNRPVTHFHAISGAFLF